MCVHQISIEALEALEARREAPAGAATSSINEDLAGLACGGLGGSMAPGARVRQARAKWGHCRRWARSGALLNRPRVTETLTK